MSAVLDIPRKEASARNGETMPAPEARQEFPRPYRAALAICSDLDDTPDAETYFELMRFLNTKETTSMGEGVGLEVGNTIYFDMPPGDFSYWNTTDGNRGKIRALIRSGHIDCIHSYGDLAATRAQAGRALEELERHGCRLKVWIDHRRAPTNFGADIMMGHGDEPGHAAYHADLTLGYGVKYVWRGRVTSVIGQDRPATLAGIADWSHPAPSLKTLAKEAIKQTLARVGNRKYRMHAGNRLMRSATLRDGNSSMEFLRCSPDWAGVSGRDTGMGVAQVLNERFLARLVARGGKCIFYTHLGKLGPGAKRFSEATIKAFRTLADFQGRGELLVTTTRRLLELSESGWPANETWPRLDFPGI